LVIEFIKILQLLTTNKGYAVSVPHTSQITIGHSTFSQSVTFFISRYLVEAPTGGHSLALSSRTVPGLSYQLLTATAHD
jgi:hypothetical protein